MAGKPKAFRRVRRNANKILVTFFVDEAGNEIDPVNIGNYDISSNDTTNLNETVATPDTGQTSTGTPQSYQGDSGNTNTSGSSDWTDHWGTPLSKGNLGDLLGGIKTGPIGLVNKLLGALGIGNDDENVTASTAKHRTIISSGTPEQDAADARLGEANLNDTQILTVLVDSGIDPRAAQGIFQLMQETSGLDPMFTQDGKQGLLGWSGSQLAQLAQFAVETKGNPIDVTTQALFTVEQIKPKRADGSPNPYMNLGAVEAYNTFVNNPKMTSEKFAQVYAEKALGITVPDTQQDIIQADVAPSFMRPDVMYNKNAPNVDPDIYSPVETSNVAGNEPLPNTTGTFGVPTALPEVNADGTIKPFAPNPLDTAPIVTSGITTTPQPKSGNALPAVYTPQSGDVKLEELIRQRDGGAVKTAGTDLVRPDGTTRPAVVNDAISGPPVGWTPDNSKTRVEPRPRVDIPVDAKGLPAAVPLDVSLAQNPVAIKKPGIFGVDNESWGATDFTPQLNDRIGMGWAPIRNVPDNTNYNQPGPMKTFDPVMPNMGMETDIGIGQSWIPKPPTITPPVTSLPGPTLAKAGFEDVEFANANPRPDVIRTPSSPTPTQSKTTGTFAPTNKNTQTNNDNNNSTPTPVEGKKTTPTGTKNKQPVNSFMNSTPKTIPVKTYPNKKEETKTKTKSEPKTETKKTDTKTETKRNLGGR